MAGKGVRGRNDAGSILRPRALFGTFSRERKYTPQVAPSHKKKSTSSEVPFPYILITWDRLSTIALVIHGLFIVYK